MDYESIVKLPLDALIFIDDGLISVRVVEKGENYVLTSQYGTMYICTCVVAHLLVLSL